MRAINAMDVVARSYPNGAHPGAAKLAAFFQACGDAARTIAAGQIVAENQYVSSSQFVAPYWNLGTDLIVTNDALVAPDGTMTADLIVPTTTSTAAHQISGLTAGGGVFVAGQPVVKSVYVKSQGYRYVRMSWPTASVSTGRLAVFDLEALVAKVDAAPATAGITDAGNGWRRIWLASVASASGSPQSGATGINTSYNTTNDVFAGNGTSGIGIWGAQFEARSAPGPYLPKAP